MSSWRVIGRNIASNWVGFAVHILVAFLLTPVIVNSLGSTTYGAWALLSSLTGYYGLLDLGLRSGLTQYLARYYANGDMVRLNETASAGFVALAALALLAAIATLVVGLNLERIFEIDPSELNTVRTAAFILGGSTALQFMFFPFAAVFTALQRFGLSNAIGISTRVASAIAAYWVLHAGHGLVGLAIVLSLTGLIDYLIRWRVAYRILPGLKLKVGFAALRRIREQVVYGVWNVVIEGSVRIIAYTDSLVIGLFLAVGAITPFALAANLVEYFSAIFRPIGYVFFPAITEQDAKDNRRAIVDLFLNGSFLLTVLVLPTAVVAYYFSDAFFRLWIGQPAESGEYPSAAALFSLLLVGAAANSCQRVAYQVYLATRRLRLVASLFLIEAVVNLALSIVLIRSLGLYGVALGTLIPAVLVQWILLPGVLCRILGVPPLHYLRRVYLRPIAVTATLVPIIHVIPLWYPLTDWLRLFAAGGFAMVISSFAIAFIGLEKNLRSRLLWLPAAKVARQLRAVLTKSVNL